MDDLKIAFHSRFYHFSVIHTERKPTERTLKIYFNFRTVLSQALREKHHFSKLAVWTTVQNLTALQDLAQQPDKSSA